MPHFDNDQTELEPQSDLYTRTAEKMLELGHGDKYAHDFVKAFERITDGLLQQDPRVKNDNLLFIPDSEFNRVFATNVMQHMAETALAGYFSKYPEGWVVETNEIAEKFRDMANRGGAIGVVQRFIENTLGISTPDGFLKVGREIRGFIETTIQGNQLVSKADTALGRKGLLNKRIFDPTSKLARELKVSVSPDLLTYLVLPADATLTQFTGKGFSIWHKGTYLKQKSVGAIREIIRVGGSSEHDFRDQKKYADLTIFLLELTADEIREFSDYLINNERTRTGHTMAEIRQIAQDKREELKKLRR